MITQFTDMEHHQEHHHSTRIIPLTLQLFSPRQEPTMRSTSLGVSSQLCTNSEAVVRILLVCVCTLFLVCVCVSEQIS